jgi:hypothetical protein
MRENAKTAMCVICAKTRSARKCEKRGNVETPKCENRENAKIAKVVALQQVQYKVLLYGLYAPIET